MASIEETALSTVVDGVAADAVQVDPRIWRLAPLRARNPASPDFSDAGLDVYLLGDPEPDGDNVTLFAVSESVRNGLKRVYTASGDPSLWAEPAPQTYDTAGTVSGSTGTPNGAANSAGTVLATGIQATHSISNPAPTFNYPVIVRPVISIAGARFESPDVTLQAVITTVLDGATSQVTRDLSYGYGGSPTVVYPAVTVAVNGSYSMEVDLQFTYRNEVAEAFAYSIAGAQIVFQVTEFTSAGA